MARRSAWRAWLVAAVAVLALIVLVQNSGRVVVRWLFWSVEAPQFALLLFTFLLGALAGYLAGRRGP
jgi:uncharacterized integral membrane protein